MRIQDKGNRFVIVDKETDKEKAKEQIERSSFVEVEHDPTKEHIQKVERWAEKWFKKGEITKAWKDYVKNRNAKPGTNSTLYKTHKEGNPVRLLTSGCNTAIEKLSRFIESICEPLTTNMKSRIKNTSHLLEIIDNLNEMGIPENTQLVSFDIVNMFPSIDNKNGIKAVKSALDSRSIKVPSTECIIEGLKICLYNNNSKFADKNLLQTNGTATGAPNSCSYSDIAVSSVDNAVFEKMNSSFSELKYFGRYRDDCLCLWCGSIEKLNEFHTFLNSINSDLKFTMEIGGNSICFLDLKITLINNKLHTTVYSKPTDSHLYLHSTSCHSKATIKGIPKGVALRLRRICSNDIEYNIKSKEYQKYLTDRGHSLKSVESAFTKTEQVSIKDARKKVKKQSPKSRIIFATNYNPRGPNVSNIIKKHLPIIENHPTLKTLFPKGSIIVANKRENNLNNLIVRSDPYNLKSDLMNNDQLGYVKCNNACDSCQNYVIATSFIQSYATGRKFKIRKELTCSTKNVIYVVYCTKCGKQGVGSTVSWKPRLANYKSHIKNKIETCRIVKHFINECPQTENLENLKFILVDTVNNAHTLSNREIDELLLEKEKFWIGTLITQHKGLNGSHDWNRKKRTEREKIE